MRNFFFLLALAALFVAADAVAEDAEKAPPPPADSWISDGDALGKWWTMRAKDFDPLRPELLYHVELDYSIEKLTGNDEETDQKAYAKLWLRKNLLNSMTAYEIRDKDYAGKKKKKEKQRFSQMFFYELWDQMDVTFGYDWYTYNRTYIDERHSWFAGPYFTLIDDPGRVLKLGVYLGYVELSYMNDDIRSERVAMGMPEEAIPYLPTMYSGMLNLMQRFSFDLTGKLTFTESASYRMYFEDSDLYSWAVNLDLNYQFTKHISVFGSYVIEEEASEAVELQNQEERDTTLNAGLRISF